MANMIVLGAAYQRGLLPVSAASIERAIELNGVAAERNREAFRVGRMVVIDPGWADAELQRRTVSPRPVVSAAARTIIETIGAEGELLRLLEIRVPELIAYQDAAYAREYAELVRRVVRAEADVLPRILAPIVKRGLVPLRFDSTRDGEHLRVHVEVEGMMGDEALRLAASFRQIVNVQSVVSAVEEAADEAPVLADAPVMRQMQAEISG
jgi:indolepyruvate ferredoxin oxidoreductase